MSRISIRRILVALGFFCAVVVVVSGGVLIWGSWITPFEKSAMRVALDRIDDVENFRGTNTEDYDTRVETARKAANVCRKRAITEYDQRLVMLLEMQLDGAAAEQKARSRQGTDPRWEKMLSVIEDGNRQIEAMLRSHVE